MSDFEERINSILSDPEQMEKITNMAKSLMGGNTGPENSVDIGGLGDLAASLSGGGIDPAALGRISHLLSAEQGGDRNKRALLDAMKPYLSPKRRDKMDKAMKLARLASIARVAMGGTGEDGEL